MLQLLILFILDYFVVYYIQHNVRNLQYFPHYWRINLKCLKKPYLKIIYSMIVSLPTPNSKEPYILFMLVLIWQFWEKLSLVIGLFLVQIVCLLILYLQTN
jgi:hypothetical protein